jgi:hypothetical protein
MPKKPKPRPKFPRTSKPEGKVGASFRERVNKSLKKVAAKLKTKKTRGPGTPSTLSGKSQPGKKRPARSSGVTAPRPRKAPDAASRVNPSKAHERFVAKPQPKPKAKTRAKAVAKAPPAKKKQTRKAVAKKPAKAAKPRKRPMAKKATPKGFFRPEKRVVGKNK